jgi:hypothetical protein
MKTLFTAKAIANGRTSETNQTPAGLPILPLGNLHDSKKSVPGHRWLAQSGQSPVRGHNELAFMTSQLG